ncbi:MAG: hypothetical protein IT210_06380 [Armatimonadetes bacterium]|nr:hypothetical protein [Armatimonadota bacterium]
MNQEFKVAVLPCSGIGRLVSTVVRQAAYRIQDLRPDDVLLVASGRAAAGEKEAVATLQKYPVLLIDGCKPRCASAIACGRKFNPRSVIWVADVAAEGKLSMVGEQRRGLTEKGYRLVEAVAQRAIKEIDRIVAEEELNTL